MSSRRSLVVAAASGVAALALTACSTGPTSEANADPTTTNASSVDKDAFPSERVYAPTTGPSLRLITCGGRFDRSVRSYEDNVVVYASAR